MASILKTLSLKIDRLLRIYICILVLKFRVDVESQSKVRVRKSKNPIWPPGGHFESHVTENQQASSHIHKFCGTEVWSWLKAKVKLRVRKPKIQYGRQAAILKVKSLKINMFQPIATKWHAHEIQKWNSKANLSYIRETMPPTESRNRKIQYGRQAAILKVMLLKINKLLPMYTSIVLLKFGVDIPSQTKVKESGNRKIQYGRQTAILKVTLLKINWLLLMATINMHMKFEIEIIKQTWVTLWKPCRVQTDRRTDGQHDSSIPTSNFVGQGYKKWKWIHKDKIGLYYILLWKLYKTMVLLHADQLNMQHERKLSI